MESAGRGSALTIYHTKLWWTGGEIPPVYPVMNLIYSPRKTDIVSTLTENSHVKMR